MVVRVVLRGRIAGGGVPASSNRSTFQSATSGPGPASISIRLEWPFWGPGVLMTTVAPTSRARVLGAAEVPELRIRHPAYVPDRTRMVSPGAIVSTACWSVAQGAVDEPLLRSLPFGAT